jgi:hypothetical protein
VTGIAAVAVGDAAAQWWPFGKQDDSPPVPSRPMAPPRGQPPAQYPPGQYPPGPPGAAQPQPTPPPFGGPQVGSNLCLQLEQRLVAEVQGIGQGRDQLPKIEADMRDLERSTRIASLRLERSDCWDTFLFSKTLKRRADCRQLNDTVEAGHQRLADLDAQRKQILGTGDHSLQDDIIRELARNGCGEQYVREARKRDAAHNPFAMLFGGDDSDDARGPAQGNQFGNLPFATYRTLCVRLCDGYYFPVSFSTLPNHFQRDSDQCHSQCAAPAELFYHQNPGGSVEQMVSFDNQQPYTSLKTAFQYRKVYTQGCSCKQAEYDPNVLNGAAEKKAQAAPRPAPALAAAPAVDAPVGAQR